MCLKPVLQTLYFLKDENVKMDEIFFKPIRDFFELLIASIIDNGKERRLDTTIPVREMFDFVIGKKELKMVLGQDGAVGILGECEGIKFVIWKDIY